MPLESDKPALRSIIERYARNSYEKQREFNQLFNLVEERIGTTEPFDYIRRKLGSTNLSDVESFLLDEGDLSFNNRGHHGATHAILTAAYTRIFADFYEKHFPETFDLDQEKKDLAMVLTAAHDVARTHGGPDHAEHKNGFYLAMILIHQYGVSERVAIGLATDVVNKDLPLTESKSIFSKLTQCADCAAIVRTFSEGEHFDIERLDAYKDVQLIADSSIRQEASDELRSILNFIFLLEDKMKSQLDAESAYEKPITDFESAIGEIAKRADGIQNESQKESFSNALRSMDSISIPDSIRDLFEESSTTHKYETIPTTQEANWLLVSVAPAESIRAYLGDFPTVGNGVRAARSSSLIWSGSEGNNVPISLYGNGKIGFTLDPNFVEVPHAEFYARNTGSRIPEKEIIKFNLAGSSAGKVDSSKYPSKKVVKRLDGHAGASKIHYVTNHAKWERLPDDENGNRQGQYHEEGSLEVFAKNVWRKFFKGKKSGDVVEEKYTGLLGYNEALVMKKEGLGNPINGIFIDTTNGDEIETGEKQELALILQENPTLKLYVYDRNRVEYIVQVAENEVAISLLQSNENLAQESIGLRNFTGFSRAAISTENSKALKMMAIPSLELDKEAANLKKDSAPSNTFRVLSVSGCKPLSIHRAEDIASEEMVDGAPSASPKKTTTSNKTKGKRENPDNGGGCCILS